MAFMVGCGSHDMDQSSVPDMSTEPQACFVDSSFLIYPDSDQDGVQVAAAFSNRCVPLHPTPNLQSGEDWCPNYKGDPGYHGCVNAMTGGSCDVPGKFSEALQGYLDFSYGFPFGSFCVPAAAEAFRQGSYGGLLISGTSFTKLGTWLEMKEGQQLTTPFAVAVSSCVQVPGAQVSWRLKNGTTGKFAVTDCANRDVTYCGVPHSRQAHGDCYFSLPMDGTLASLTANDPRLHLTLYYPTINRGVKRYDELLADGKEIPRGFLQEIECSGTCTF